MGLPKFKTVITDYLDNEITGKKDHLAHFPYYSANNHWETIESSGRDDWVGGFWPGILWLAAAENRRWEHLAERATRHVIPALNNNFNIGFRNNYSWAAGFAGTGNKEMKKMGLKATDRLYNCFHESTGLIGHRPNNKTLISGSDMLMNLPLLYWAISQKPKTDRYRQAVKTTLNKSAQILVRDDNSLHHLIKFNLETEEIVDKISPQGKSRGCWSRGLAWATTGFVLGGIVFDENEYFKIAEKLFTYHDQNTADIIPAFDYAVNANEYPDLTDTSAAAILASGLLLQAQHNRNSYLQRRGEEIVHTLFTKYRRDNDKQGLIGGGCYHQPSGEGINAATIWGDYFALEALYLAKKETLPPQLDWLNQAA